MKKILSIFALLMTIVIGAKAADETIFLWKYDGSTTYGDGSNDGEFTVTPAANPGTIKFATYEKKKTSAEGTIGYATSVTDNDLKPNITKGCKLGNNGAHLKISLASGNFQAGDIIYICAYNPVIVSVGKDEPASTGDVTGEGVISSSLATGSAKGSYAVGSVTLPSNFTATDRIYISRVSSSVGVAAIKVVRPEVKPAKAYTVTAASNNTDYGTAAAEDASLDSNETTDVTATPKAGYQFVSWSVEGEGSTLTSTTTNPTTLTMGTANATVTATFSAINYAITHNDATGGTYTISVAGGEAVSTNTTATIGQTITLAGTPTDPAQTYIRWNVKDADNNDVTVTSNQFTMPAKAVTISPVFSKPLNTLFSMTGITAITNDTENAKYGTITATISDGGSVDVFNNKGDADGLLYSNSINLNGSGDNYIHITFPTKLVAGDEISATFLAASQGWKLNKTKSKSGAVEKTNPYTLTASDALIGATELYIYKIDAGCQISAITVKGEGQLSDLEVTSSATPVVAIGATNDIEYTSSSTGAMTFTSSDEEVATVSATGVITGIGGGTATITIEQAADDDYRAGVATVTVTVPETALLKIKALGSSSTKTSGTASFTADVNLSSNKKMDKGRYFGFSFTGDDAFQTNDVVEIKITAAGQAGTFKFYDNTTDDPTMLYDTEVAPDEAKTYRFVMPAEMEGVKTVYLRRGGDESGINEGFNPVFDYIAVYRPDATITLNANGFATYSNAEDFEFAGAQAYKMALTTTSLQGTEVTGKIPAGEGILFKGTPNATVSIINTTGAEEISGNDLMGTTPATGDAPAPDYTNHKYFVLKGNTFKPYSGANFTANKAYFEVDKAFSAQSLDMTFDDAPTAVEAVAEAKVNVNVPVKVIKNGQLFIGNYNVAGQRVK